MNDAVVLVLSLALVVVLVAYLQQHRVETLVAMPQAISILPETKQLLDRALIYFVVSGYLKAAHEMTPTNKVKPLCESVIKAARRNVATTLRQKLAPFKPVAKEGLMETARRLMRRVETHIRGTHCARGTNGSVHNMQALATELGQLSASFNTGVPA